MVVDKPAGPTSHDVVDRVRTVFHTRHVGHTGTLDPFATGVLPVCVGKATRLASHLTRGEKLYRATVRFGFATTTDDLNGAPLGAPRATDLDPDRLHALLAGLTGPIMQVPPAFSAKHHGGRRLHELAREGVEVERRAVPVNVRSIQLLSLDGDCAAIEVRCSPGTYVRALARDLGESAGTGAHLVQLRRLASGPFTCERAVPLDRLPEDARAALVPLSDLLTDWPAVRVGPDGEAAVRHGRDITRSLALSSFPATALDRPLRVLDESGNLLALASCRGGFNTAAEAPHVDPVLHPDVVLIDDASVMAPPAHRA